MQEDNLKCTRIGIGAIGGGLGGFMTAMGALAFLVESKHSFPSYFLLGFGGAILTATGVAEVATLPRVRNFCSSTYSRFFPAEPTPVINEKSALVPENWVKTAP
jgi:hypothetical protein